jgi:putative CocE/NonD family hydrolase
MQKLKTVILVILSLSVTLVASEQPRDNVTQRISEPGRYSGYSEPLYDNWQRSSVYVPMRDGVKIAVDIFRPTLKGRLHSEPLPVIWEHRRYQRASQGNDGRIYSQLDRQDHPMRKVVLHGYIYAVAAVRGSGASFGTRVDPTPPQESLDAYDITEWLATQSWCSGKVGMYGISYSGTDQFMAASTSPPHLKAIFPEMAMFDLYELCYPGGIFRHTMMIDWAQQIQGLDRYITRRAAPVDGDKEHILLRQALEQHKANFDVSRASEVPYRDSVIDNVGSVYVDNSPSSVVEQVNQSGVAVYLRAGWYDIFPRDMLLWFNNLDMPKKIVIGPWNHYQSYNLDRSTEILRWYDHWLKGIDNGIMDEPPIHYTVMGAPDEDKFREAHQWPIPQARNVKYYLHRGPSGSVRSVNDGLLSSLMSKKGFDSYVTNYTTTSGKATRWYGQAVPAYPDMTINDQKALTYTTEPLTKNVEIMGHPVVHIWLQCSADDIDVFAYLEEVDKNGKSTYITEGCLRASHRKLKEAPHNRMDIPYHRSFKEDIEPLPNEPVELVFDLYPTANFFEASHRIRISITCADRDNYQTHKQNPTPEITVYRNAEYSSYVILPIYKQ